MRKIGLVLVCIGMILGLTGCLHEHIWSEATCTAPKTCTECGETEGEALGHTWNDATCTTPKTCTVCGETEGEPLGHTWSEATCTEPKTCEICGETEGEALGHTWEAATCQAPKTCSVCGVTEGEPLEHQVEEWNVIQEATCVEVGQKEGICTLCGETIQEEIPLAEHTAGDWEVSKEPTENAKGERVKKCISCGQVLETEEYDKSPEEIEEEYKAECKKYSYDEIARNPNQYTGEKAKFTGEVIQVMQENYSGSLVYTLRVNVTKGKYYYDDTVLVFYVAGENDSRILEDDIVTLYGSLNGEYTYETVMGSSVTIPCMLAEYIDIQ